MQRGLTALVRLAIDSRPQRPVLATQRRAALKHRNCLGDDLTVPDPIRPGAPTWSSRVMHRCVERRPDRMRVQRPAQRRATGVRSHRSLPIGRHLARLLSCRRNASVRYRIRPGDGAGPVHLAPCRKVGICRAAAPKVRSHRERGVCRVAAAESSQGDAAWSRATRPRRALRC
jgi:hypothetical protein